ncbi:MAG: DUF559 domain-containing protein [Acidimicrobiales bacterium]
MADADQTIIRLGLANDGVVALAALRAAGISTSTLYRRRQAGFIEAVTRGLFVIPALRTERTTLRVATTTIPTALVSHFSAAKLHGMWVPSYYAKDTPEVLVGYKRGTDLPGIKVHETRQLPHSHGTNVGGLPTTTAARTFRDIGFRMSFRVATHVAQRIISDNLATAAELAAAHLVLARRGRAGTVFTRTLLDAILADETHPTSELEIRMQALLRDHNIAGFKAQFAPPWYSGRDGIVDFANPTHKIIIEVDGRRWHSVQQQLDIDRKRDRLAQRHGWVPLRFNWTEVVHESELVIDHLRTMLERQRQLHAA